MPVFEKATKVELRWIALFALGLPVLALFLLGPDGNWDLRNYHLYNPHAWLSGRWRIDVAAAQVQSWHSPLLDVPLYWITASGLNAHWASAWLVLPTMASLFVLLQMQRRLAATPPSRADQFALALLAVSGAASYSTLGTSSNDAFVAAAMLACLYMVLAIPLDTEGRRRWLLAGLLAGGVAGLKLTAVIYCVGLASAALVAGPLRQALPRLASLALGGLGGFLLTYGYWGWRLYELRRNPVFPYFNNFFQSPGALPLAYADERFVPGTLPDALLAPIHLLANSTRFSEIRLSDPRLLLALAGFTVLLLLQRRPGGDGGKHRGFALLLAFSIGSFLAWVLQYGIYRYALALEMLGVLALVLLLQRLPRWRNAALVLAVLLVSADTKRPHWGHFHTSAAPMAGIHAPAIEPDSLVLIASDEPLAYLALGLPDTVPLVSVRNNFMHPGRCLGVQREAEQALAGHAGPVWLLHGETTGRAPAQALVTRFYGLEPDGACVDFANSLGPAQLCRQRRAGIPRTNCPAVTPPGTDSRSSRAIPPR